MSYRDSQKFSRNGITLLDKPAVAPKPQFLLRRYRVERDENFGNCSSGAGLRAGHESRTVTEAGPTNHLITMGQRAASRS